jgi:hypothetical protein
MKHYCRFRNHPPRADASIQVASTGSLSSAPVAASSLSDTALSRCPPPNSFIDLLAVYDGKPYASTRCASAIYVFDGTTWSLSHCRQRWAWIAGRVQRQTVRRHQLLRILPEPWPHLCL